MSPGRPEPVVSAKAGSDPDVAPLADDLAGGSGRERGLTPAMALEADVGTGKPGGWADASERTRPHATGRVRTCRGQTPTWPLRRCPTGPGGQSPAGGGRRASQRGGGGCRGRPCPARARRPASPGRHPGDLPGARRRWRRDGDRRCASCTPDGAGLDRLPLRYETRIKGALGARFTRRGDIPSFATTE